VSPRSAGAPDDPDALERRRSPEMAAVLMVVVAIAAAVLVARSSVGEASAPPEACREILRRYADARLRQADPRPSASALAAHRADVLERAERSSRFGRCPRALSAAAAECALAAGDADQIERCLQ
jgi:hypothetical protein